MKKIFVFAAMAAMVFTACNNNQIANVDELELGPEISMSIANLSTKGYVEGSDFVDTPYDALHPSTPGNPRKMMLSAYLTPQSGASANYFVGQEFAKNANGETDDKWHHNPKVYWPMGGTLSFLAYSSTIPFAGTAVFWDEDNAANKVVLGVSEEYLQDDILFSAIPTRGSQAGPAAGAADVALTFNHTQAWIQFQIKSESANLVKINEIIIEDLYSRGELTLTGGATPKAEWNFRRETASDRAMDDTYAILAPAYIPVETAYMDMLVPEQRQTAFVLHYTLEGQDNILEYRYDLSTEQWLMGKKYVYEITFKPYEIVVVPTVTAFTAGAVPADFPSELE